MLCAIIMYPCTMMCTASSSPHTLWWHSILAHIVLCVQCCRYIDFTIYYLTLWWSWVFQVSTYEYINRVEVHRCVQASVGSATLIVQWKYAELRTLFKNYCLWHLPWPIYPYLYRFDFFLFGFGLEVLSTLLEELLKHRVEEHWPEWCCPVENWLLVQAPSKNDHHHFPRKGSNWK